MQAWDTWGPTCNPPPSPSSNKMNFKLDIPKQLVAWERFVQQELNPPSRDLPRSSSDQTTRRSTCLILSLHLKLFNDPRNKIVF